MGMKYINHHNTERQDLKEALQPINITDHTRDIIFVFLLFWIPIIAITLLIFLAKIPVRIVADYKNLCRSFFKGLEDAQNGKGN